MRVVPSRILAVLEPEAPVARRPLSSAASPQASERAAQVRATWALGRAVRASTAAAAPPPVASLAASTAPSAAGASSEAAQGPSVAGASRRSLDDVDCDASGAAAAPAAAVAPVAPTAAAAPASALELLHTARGFLALEAWFRKALALAPAASIAASSAARSSDLGLLWPLALCSPSGLPEPAFLELLRAFADCSESEALDLFDLLDHDCLGVLAFRQVYIAVCIVAAIGDRKLTRLLYFHSHRLFDLMLRGSRFSCGATGRVGLPHVIQLLRLFGCPGHLLSACMCARGLEPTSLVSYEGFMDVAFPMCVLLDRGDEVLDAAVVTEGDKVSDVRSRVCCIV